MAISPSFTASQPIGQPSQIKLTDTSTGTDVTITTRRVFFIDAYGNFLVQDGTGTDYEVWTDFPGTTTITLDILSKDYALIIKVQWLTSGGTVVNEVIHDVQGFTYYNEQFDYQLTQLLSGNPLLINDGGFFNEKSTLRTDIDSGNQAIEQALDQYGAQQCYDRATDLRLNSQYVFNGNN